MGRNDLTAQPGRRQLMRAGDGVTAVVTAATLDSSRPNWLGENSPPAASRSCLRLLLGSAATSTYSRFSDDVPPATTTPSLAAPEELLSATGDAAVGNSAAAAPPCRRGPFWMPPACRPAWSSLPYPLVHLPPGGLHGERPGESRAYQLLKLNHATCGTTSPIRR